MSIRSTRIHMEAEARYRFGRLPSPWRQILRSDATAVEKMAAGGDDGPRILCATSVGASAAVLPVDSLVAMALAARGAEPHMLLCDQVLPACEVATVGQFPRIEDFVERGPQHGLCRGCYAQGYAHYRPLPLPLLRYSDFITKQEVAHHLEVARGLSVEECCHYVHDGIEVGEHVRANLLRFFGSGTLADTELTQAVAARYLAGALTAMTVVRRVFEQIQPVCSVAHHGIYVPQGVVGQVARDRGIRVVNWGPSYRNTTVIYSHGDTYHRTLMDEPTANWRQMLWTEMREQQIDEYLAERRQGKGDWSWMAGVAEPIEQRDRLVSELGLDPAKPIIGLLTNVLYDANLFYQSNAFEDMLAWLFVTIDYFIDHSGLQLVIRIHPHEHQSAMVVQCVGAEIKERYGTLPASIKVIPSESNYSTYALMALCRAVLIYGTKTGVELAPTGVPVIVAGEAWIRNKGVTHDVSTREDYRDVLRQLPTMQRSSRDVVTLAKKFAYHFFFRRMIPLASLDPDADWPPRLRIHALSDLRPGKDPGLDVVCEGILRGKEFVYDPPEERVAGPVVAR